MVADLAASAPAVSSALVHWLQDKYQVSPANDADPQLQQKLMLQAGRNQVIALLRSINERQEQTLQRDYSADRPNRTVRTGAEEVLPHG